MKKYKNYLFGFSLVELLISLIVISCITAAFTPIITKKFSSGVLGGDSVSDITIKCEQFGEHCNLCTNNICLACSGLVCQGDEFIHDKSCSCKKCKDEYNTSCLKCDETKCTSCETGKFPSGRNCLICNTKYPNCTTCDETKCTSCENNYKLVDGACVPDCTKLFTSSCTACDIDNCTTCAGGYDLINGRCVANCPTKFGSACATCSATACTGCISGYKLSGSTCVPDCNALFGANCTSCTASACTACKSGYGVVNGNCYKCTNFNSQCTSCNNSGCTGCSSGYELKSGNCAATCATRFGTGCTNCSNTACTTCTSGYMVSGGKCVSCTVFHQKCKECTESSGCKTCATGYNRYYTNVGGGYGYAYSCKIDCATLYDPNCTYCNEYSCLGCDYDYSLSGNSCLPCDRFDYTDWFGRDNVVTHWCMSCTATECTRWLSSNEI